MASCAERYLLAACTMMTFACGATVTRTIKREWIGTPKAALGAYMQCLDREEDTPGGIRHDVVRDQATLASVANGETCIDVVIRTNAGEDEPLDQLDPKCSASSGMVSDESVSVLDYAYVGSVEKIAVQGVAASAFLGLSISEPGEKVFRVIERRARVCCAVEATAQASLKLVSKRMMHNNLSYSEEFVWQLQ